MADQASIFEPSGQQPANQQQAPAQGSAGPASGTDELATLLGNIKNERGEPKYKTVQEALKALQHSQEYIPSLKSKTDELQAQLEQAQAQAARVTALETVVQQLTQRNDPPQNTNAPGLSEEQIAELVNRTLTKTQQENLQRSNLESVVSTMKQSFGDKAEEVFYNKAKELGLSIAEFNGLAAKTPKAVLELIGIGKTRESVSTPGINTAGFQPKKDSFVGRNTKSALSGASSADILQERENVKNLVTELHEQGLTVHDLTDPKTYFKVFK